MIMAQWRVMITGATGLLGRAIQKEFVSSQQWETLGLGFSRLGEGITKLDLTNVEETRKVVKEFQPNVIIHAAAERRPDKVEHDKEAAKKLNVASTKLLSELVAEMNGESNQGNHFILYISTDYVFDGNNAPYKPTDTTNPLNEYGRHKLEGERMVTQYCPDGGILRVPVLYGETKDLKESAVTVLFESVKKSNNPTSIDNYQKRYPTFTDDVARICRLICEERMKDPSFKGIWHWSGPDCMTKYIMTKTMAELYGLSYQQIVPLNSPTPSSALRPYNSALDTKMLECKFKTLAPKTPFGIGIKKVLDKLVL